MVGQVTDEQRCQAGWIGVKVGRLFLWECLRSRLQLLALCGVCINLAACSNNDRRGDATTPTDGNGDDAGDTPALVASLAAAGVHVRSFHGKGGRLDNHLRITVGTPAENDTLLAALPD